MKTHKILLENFHANFTQKTLINAHKSNIQEFKIYPIKKPKIDEIF